MVSQNFPQPPDDKPEPINFGGYSPPQQSGGTNTKDRLMNILLTVVISAVVCFIFTSWLFPSVSKGDFDKNITNMSKTDESLNNRVSSLEDLKAKIGEPSNYALKSELNQFLKLSDAQSQYTKVGDFKTTQDKVTVLNSDLYALKTKVDALPSTSSADTATINSLKGQMEINVVGINSLGKEIDTVEASTKDLQTKVDALAKTVIDLQTKIDALQKTTTTTTTTGSSSTVDGVTATIISNAFTGTPNITMPALTNEQSSTAGSFTIQLVNNTNKSLSGVQLAVSLGLFDNTNQGNPKQFSLPKNVSASLSSNGNLSLIWNAQATGVAYVLGFTNQVNTGTFSFGNLVVPPGVTTYVQTLNLVQMTGSTTYNTTPDLIVIPAIKVASAGTAQ